MFVRSGVLCRATRRAVSGNTACCVGQRGVLCGATRRAVWDRVYVMSVLLGGFAHDGWGEEEGLAVGFFVAMGTDGDDVVLDGHLAGDGDEGTTGFFAQEDGVADGAALGAVEGVAGVALPIAEGAGDEGSVRGWLLAYYLHVGVMLVPEIGVHFPALDADLGLCAGTPGRDDEHPVAVGGDGVACPTVFVQFFLRPDGILVHEVLFVGFLRQETCVDWAGHGDGDYLAGIAVGQHFYVILLLHLIALTMSSRGRRHLKHPTPSRMTVTSFRPLTMTTCPRMSLKSSPLSNWPPTT